MLKSFRRRTTASEDQASSTSTPAANGKRAAKRGMSGFSSASTTLRYGSAASNNLPDGADIDINNSAYASRWRALMDLHKTLNDLGAEAFYPVPRITVIGGQSAGKSSLVEAVSGLNVPRDAGVCTRCPMECVMKKTEGPWTCRIAIRKDSDLPMSEGTQQCTVDFGPIITRKEDMNIWLRRAQAAILSPHRSFDTFHGMSAEELNEPDAQRLPFSRNAIVVNLEDRDLTNMSFVDLPGLISNAEQHYVDMVDDLVRHRISGDNTIILVTAPMTDDIETIKALKLAHEADPGGQRTIAVLTKPDIIRTGATSSRERWRRIMDGQEAKHKLRHGYFGVLLPDDDGRAAHISRDAMRTRSQKFFSSEQPWRKMNQQRFGVTNLVAYVGSLLVRLIEKSIPGLREAVTLALRECEGSLAQLPAEHSFDTNSDVNTYITQQITKFCALFDHAVMGESSSPHKDLVQTNRRHYEHFKLAIGRTRPDFRPFENKDDYRSPGFGMGEGTGPIDLQDIREVIDKSIAWELPRHVPYEATKVLVMRITAHWSEPALRCAANVVEATDEKMLAMIQMCFGQFEGLRAHVQSVVAAHLAEHADNMEVSLSKALKLETGQPLFTQNTHYLETEEAKWLQLYGRTHYHHGQYYVCHPPPSPSSVPPLVHNSGVSEWPPQSHVPATSRTSRSTTPPPVRHTRVSEELEVMAKVHAYVQVAYKRIIDHVPLLVEHDFNQELAKDLLEIILRSFNVMSDGEKRALLSEVREVADIRTALKGKRGRLVSIQKKLDEWEITSQDSGECTSAIVQEWSL
ncbi:P-loop containing nucleoside triphosphate hydrolase protein [Schizophyllum fasciatum]